MLLLAAILPSIVLFTAVRILEKKDRTPVTVLLRLFLCGILAIIPIVILGFAIDMALSSVFDPTGIAYLIIDTILATALAEEGGKFLALFICTRKKQLSISNAVMCSVSATLGFATVENILYVLDEGAENALWRALISVPVHVLFAVTMGYFYGRYRKERKLALALVIPVIMHALYDLILDLMSGTMP